MRLRYSALLAAAPVVFWLAPATVRAQQADCTSGSAAGYPCSNVDLLARMPLATFGPGAVRVSETWGWTDPSNGREYAIMGVVDGTVFVDVTVPTAPVYVGKLTTAVAHPTDGRWRTFRTYANHVFVGSEIPNHGVQVFDLTRLRSVTSPPQTFEADARYTGTGNAHTLTINQDIGHLYIAGGTDVNTADCHGGGLHIVDVTTPTVPTFAGCFDASGYTHEAECLTYQGPDTTYAGRQICVAYNVNHVAFVDVTNPAAPALISTGSYPTVGYTHQGTFTADWRYLIVNDETDETNGSFPTARTIILDVQDLDDVEYVGAHLSAVPSTDHNLYVVGSLVYQANDMAGLRILSTDQVASATLQEVAYFDTYPAANMPGFEGLWMAYPFFASGIVVGGDRTGGLFVLRPDPVVVASDAPSGDVAVGLSAPAPNPTRDRSTLTLTVDRAQRVRAEAFDALGRRVAMVFDGAVAAGSRTTLVIEAGALPAGVYVLRVTGETFATSARLSVVR
jgi:choice-of-anchor B domain-containing protein